MTTHRNDFAMYSPKLLWLDLTLELATARDIFAAFCPSIIHEANDQSEARMISLALPKYSFTKIKSINGMNMNIYSDFRSAYISLVSNWLGWEFILVVIFTPNNLIDACYFCVCNSGGDILPIRSK